MNTAMDANEFENEFEGPAVGALNGALAPGMRGWEVKELQGRLVALGFQGVKPSGVYDGATAHAVQAIQRALKRTENGIFDALLDALVREAETQPDSDSAQAIAAAAAAWGAGQMTLAGIDATPQAVQVVENEPPFWKKPSFWLIAGGGALTLYLLLTGGEKKKPAFVEPGAEPSGGDDPDDFFGTAPRRRRPKRKHKGKAKKTLAAAPEADGSGEPEVIEPDEEPEDVKDVAGPAETDKKRSKDGRFLPADGKPRRKRKPKAKALAATSAAEPGVERGEDTDADIEADDAAD